jgi:hypothetical protein
MQGTNLSALLTRGRGRKKEALNQKLGICMVVASLAFFKAVPVLAGSVFVTEPLSGNIISVDEVGTKTIYASGLGRPGLLKFDKNENLFVLDFSEQNSNPRILKVTPTGVISTFTTGIPQGNLGDLTIADDGTLFLLVIGEEPTVGEATAEVWQLVEGGDPVLLATTVNDTPLGQSARGFTFGPGGHLYLAMQGGQGTARIIRVTRLGEVSTFFDSELPSLDLDPAGTNFIDVRFNSQEDMFILARVAPATQLPLNPCAILKVHKGSLSTLVGPALIGSEALQLTIDANDNLFVSGGGFQAAAPDGFIQRIDPAGNVTTLATFPPTAGQSDNPIFDIDDDSFDSFPSEEIPVAIDIKPGEFPNSINPKSKGVIPVAILTTAAFDATTVDPTTVLFGATGTESAPVHSALQDVDGNGGSDLLLHFKTQATGIRCGDTSASLTGETFSKQAIEGTDSIKTVGCK